MLKPEEARKRLKEFKTKDRQAARVAALPEPLRGWGYGLLERREDGKHPNDWEKRVKLQDAAARALTTASEKERLRVFAALFPKIAPHVESGWQLVRHLPYGGEYDSRPFRSPNRPERLAGARFGWIEALCGMLAEYEEDIEWVAAWAPHLGYQVSDLGILLAGAIAGGGDDGEAVFQILLESGRNEHEVGSMGSHVLSALLCSPRPEGWEWVERLLLAAQRQEGLRQSILEEIESAQPEAFARMVRLIVENDLHRFSAVVQAVNGWLGLELDVSKAAAVKSLLGRMASFLGDPGAAEAGLASPEPQTAYLALWSIAFRDADAALEPAQRLLNDPDTERRLAAALLLAELGTIEARAALLPALDDPDLRVAWAAFEAVSPQYREDEEVPAELRARLWDPFLRLLERAPKKGGAITVEWAGKTLEPKAGDIGYQLPAVLGKRPARELIPYLGSMDPYARSRVAEALGKAKKDPEARRALFAMTGDVGEWVRSEAFDALKKQQPDETEALGLEKLLSRKADDLRRGVPALLLRQSDAAALASADRLLAAKGAMERIAGLDLLRQMVAAKRQVAECRARAAAFGGSRSLSEAEQDLVDRLTGAERDAPTLTDALGLLDPAQRTVPIPPRAMKVILRSEASVALVKGLDALVKKHREQPITLRWGNDEDDEEASGAKEETELLGNVNWGFPEPDPRKPADADADAARLPLRETWEEWYSARPADARDKDGFELLRAITSFDLPKGPSTKHHTVVTAVLLWMLRLHPPAGAVSFLLDAAEQSLTEIPEKTLKKASKYSWDEGWRDDDRWMTWVNLCKTFQKHHPGLWSPEDHARLWKLLRWIDEPGFQVPRFRPELEEAVRAHAVGAAAEADLLDLLLARDRVVAEDAGAGDDEDDDDYEDDDDFSELSVHSRRKPTSLCREFPALAALIERCRARILEIELGRGDLPTAASKPALQLSYAGGAEVLVRALRALGSGKLARGYIYNDDGRAAVFSTLIRATHPSAEDAPERFAELAREAGLPEQRLIDLAFYAPQWAQYVERAVEWPLLAEAVWWIHAHTKDEQWNVDAEVREAWAAQVSERTPLSNERLLEGAVDVDWFRRIYAAVGRDRWKRVDEAARYASSGTGHKRAQLFADAMLGKLNKDDLVALIRDKRRQDSLRALGLLPLPEGTAGEAEVLERYQIIQEFLRGSKQFGAQRQVSEKLAASIALENLAATAGYPDPMRLQWAMEAREIEDLAAGPIIVTAAEISLTLSINEWGEPELAITKAGKPLKAVPAAVKKDAGILALQERKREVQRQAARMRFSLEAAMCRGDAFRGAELVRLLEHPVLAPMLRSLVFTAGDAAGYPVEGGRALESHAGTVQRVAAKASLRIAHPHDLLGTGEWHLWQKECFRRERIQPFKQVFRELYVLTPGESDDRLQSRRYAGHQVNSRQARALLGKRGWVSNLEEGDVRRTFFHEDLTASIDFDYGYTTPAEVEGLTLDHVGFTRRGHWDPIPLEQVPPRVFSEVMRDVDLVVSVAHQGGVDPEATASTVEMRAALLRETCGLLKLENVRLQDSHALVAGKLGDYTIHLGSAVVHRQPGGHLCIVPVHSQHRGRIFLPFADPDPRTAEVVSKVLLLARDDQIQDPTILQQIYGSA